MDKYCQRCKIGLRLLKKHPLQENEAVVILPEKNNIGGIKAFHIARVSKEILKDTKIYKQLKEME